MSTSGSESYYQTKEGKLLAYLLQRHIDQLLKEISRGKLLHIRCGTGFWTHYFSSLGYDMIALDPNPDHIQIAQSQGFVDIDFQKGDEHTFALQPPEDLHQQLKKRLIFRRPPRAPDYWKLKGLVVMFDILDLQDFTQLLSFAKNTVQSNGFFLFVTRNASQEKIPAYGFNQYFPEWNSISKSTLSRQISAQGDLTWRSCGYFSPQEIDTLNLSELITHEKTFAHVQDRLPLFQIGLLHFHPEKSTSTP